MSSEIRKRHSFFAKKIAKKVIRDTCPSITYYFAKYHVILCKVSLVSKNAIVGLFGLSSVLSHTDSTENTNVEPDWLCCMSFLRTRIVRMTLFVYSVDSSDSCSFS